jgi:hypothetical protein
MERLTLTLLPPGVEPAIVRKGEAHLSFFPFLFLVLFLLYIHG